MAEYSKQCTRKISGRGQATIAWQAAILTHDKASKRWKLLLRAILLHWAQRVANAGAMQSGDALDNAVREHLAMRSRESQDTPKLLCSLFACHGIIWI